MGVYVLTYIHTEFTCVCVHIYDRYMEFVYVGVYICVYVHRVYMDMCIHRMGLNCKCEQV